MRKLFQLLLARIHEIDLSKLVRQLCKPRIKVLNGEVGRVLLLRQILRLRVCEQPVRQHHVNDKSYYGGHVLCVEIQVVVALYVTDQSAHIGVTRVVKMIVMLGFLYRDLVLQRRADVLVGAVVLYSVVLK